AVDEGTVAKIVVAEGTQGVKVNSVIAILAAEGEDVAEAAKGEASASKTEEAPKQEAAPKAKKQEPAPAPAAAKEQPKQEAKSQQSSGGGGREFASPPARGMGAEAGIDVSAVAGSRPRGRIVKADVEAASSGGSAAKAESAAPSAQASKAAVQPMSDDAVLKLFEEGSYELIPHDNMRRTIARRLVEAKSTVPHFYLTLDCEID